MNRVELEYFYLSGLPINLEKEKLGIIHQPRIRDFVLSGIDISSFSHPFILSKDMIAERNEGVDDALSKLGRLKFLMVYDELTEATRKLTGQSGIIDLLKQALKMLYKTDDITVISTISTIIVGGNVLINDDSFEILSTLIIEMLRIDIEEMRKKIEQERKEKEEETDPWLKLFKEREKEFNEKTKKDKKDFSILDVVNIVVHGQEPFDYDRVFNYTVYQLKNTYETLIKKENFNINLLHRISPNFQVTDDLKLWEEKTNIAKSSLNK